MSVYHKLLSRFLLFFSILLISFFIFMESQIVFPWIVRFTTNFFPGLHMEKISGNWRDMTFKNVQYNMTEASITAKNIHLLLDVSSLLHTTVKFKKCEVEDVVVRSKKQIFHHSIKEDILNNTYKKNMFFSYPIIFSNIYINKFLLKNNNSKITVENIFTSLELKNSNMIFLSTNIDLIKITQKYIPEKIEEDKAYMKYSFISYNKIHSLLCLFAHIKHFFIPISINYNFLKCKKVHFFYDKNDIFFQIDLKAQLQKNIFSINYIKIKNNFFEFQSYGKIFSYKNSISCLLNNKIFMPYLHDKSINFFIQAHLNDKLSFKIKSSNFYSFNIHGKIDLNKLNHPFWISVNSKKFFILCSKNIFLKSKHFHFEMCGNLKHYSLFFKNMISVAHCPSFFLRISGRGNLKKIFLKSIYISSSEKMKLFDNIHYLTSFFKKNDYISTLTGKIHISNNLKNDVNKIHISNIDLFSGQNKFNIKGDLLDQTFDITSSLHANHLDYFFPNVKGLVQSNIKLYGDYAHPKINSRILFKNFCFKNMFFKQAKIRTKINTEKVLFGKIFLHMFKIDFLNFHFDQLHAFLCFRKNYQKFSFILQNSTCNVDLVLKNFINKKTGKMRGIIQKINIHTIWGHVFDKDILIFYQNKISAKNDHIKQEKIYFEDNFFSFLKNNKQKIFNWIKHQSIDLNSFINIKGQWIWNTEKCISNARFFFTSKKTILNKFLKEKNINVKIDYFKLSVNLINDTLKIRWKIKNNNIFRKKINISGRMNILDIYEKKLIQGKCLVFSSPLFLIHFFILDINKINGSFNGKIFFFGSLSHFRIFSNFNMENIYIKSNNILQYISLLFSDLPKSIAYLKIDQEIFVKKARVFFRCITPDRNSNTYTWNAILHSKEIIMLTASEIPIHFSSKLNLHYSSFKYDLKGYIKFYFFYFKIDKKNISF